MSNQELKALGEEIRKATEEWSRYDELRLDAHAVGRRPPKMPAGLIAPLAIQLFQLIATTGMRPGEAMQLQWNEIDFETRTLNLADSKTGRSKRPLGEAAITVLETIDRLSNSWVFPATKGGGPTTIKKPIVALLARAGVGASPKALRSTFASVAADEGYSSGTIGELLGHARVGVTERHYIRRIDAVLLAAADVVSSKIARLLSDT